jgi:DNA mismatch repair protein MSH5
MPEFPCSHLLSTHELGQLLDEEMTEAEMDELEQAEAVCRRFMTWNLEETKVSVCTKKRLAEVLARAVN